MTNPQAPASAQQQADSRAMGRRWSLTAIFANAVVNLATAYLIAMNPGYAVLVNTIALAIPMTIATTIYWLFIFGLQDYRQYHATQLLPFTVKVASAYLLLVVAFFRYLSVTMSGDLGAGGLVLILEILSVIAVSPILVVPLARRLALYNLSKSK